MTCTALHYCPLAKELTATWHNKITDFIRFDASRGMPFIVNTDHQHYPLLTLNLVCMCVHIHYNVYAVQLQLYSTL